MLPYSSMVLSLEWGSTLSKKYFSAHFLYFFVLSDMDWLFLCLGGDSTHTHTPQVLLLFCTAPIHLVRTYCWLWVIHWQCECMSSVGYCSPCALRLWCHSGHLPGLSWRWLSTLVLMQLLFLLLIWGGPVTPSFFCFLSIFPDIILPEQHRIRTSSCRCPSFCFFKSFDTLFLIWYEFLKNASVKQEGGERGPVTTWGLWQNSIWMHCHRARRRNKNTRQEHSINGNMYCTMSAL